MEVTICGMDGSLRNFGIAVVRLNIETMEMKVDRLDIFKTEKGKEKTVRKSSDNLERAQSIARSLKEALKGSISVFAEVPSGGQSYDAVLGFGIVIGLYASVDVPLLEVSPSETKKAAVGTRTASKQEIIDWAFNKFPDAPWRTRKLKGAIVPTNDNEHIADAVAIVHAGIKTPAFQQTLQILRSQITK
jgi:hypothetical protein